MGLGKFFGLPASSSSSSSSSRPRGGDPPPLGSGSSKFDYTYGLNPPGPSTSPGLAHSFFHGDNDAPPAYSPQNNPSFNDYATATDIKMPMPETSHTGVVHFPTPAIHNPVNSAGEAPLRALFRYEIVIILDDSHSMMNKDAGCTKSRWDQAWDALATLVEVGIRYDKNGIDLHFLNQRDKDKQIKSVAELRELRKRVRVPNFQTYTPTGDVLDELLCQYRARLVPEIKKIKRGLKSSEKRRIFLVITDGDPTDSPEDVIINAAQFYQKNHLPIDQVGIQFVQVGNDPEATKWLENLDGNLTKEMGQYARDIVDTIKFNGRDLEGQDLIKAMTGGFNRRQDRVGES